MSIITSLTRYAVGGYHSTDTGCPAWGTSDPSDIRFIGDHLGDLVITYADGSSDTVPLILGYTLWLHSTWMETPAPFMGEGKDDALAACLMEVLALYGVWDRREKWVLRVALRELPVTAVEVVSNPDKNPARPVLSVYTVPWGTVEDQPLKKGAPVFTEAYITDAETLPVLGDDASDFFASHTVNPQSLPMDWVTKNLAALCYALHTFDGDFEQAPAFEIPDDYHNYRVRFSGSPLAEIATGAVYHNMRNLCDRTDPDGFIHTSYHNAPSWRYDGFGPYVLKANSYYDAYYARDCARAILTLNSFGETNKALASCHLGNEYMMAYPRDGVTLGGIPIPGHFSVMCNKPYIYSHLLIHHGWLLEKCGFSHDPVVTMLADTYGYDTADMPADWVARSRAIYSADLAKTVDFGYYGARGGIGYDHSMMTQNALLLDQTADAGQLVESLCRICYAPRLPEPYLVPEGMAIDARKGIFRRQGDLGNLVQLAEAMKCFHIVTGISPVWGDTVKIMPRLPKGWQVSVKDFPLVNTKAAVDMETAYPADNTQSMTLTLHGEIPAQALRIRFGPFASDCETVTVTLNQISHTLPTESSGDATWAWLTVDVSTL